LRLEPVRASLPLLPAVFLGVVFVGTFFLADAVFAVAAFLFVGATLRAPVFGVDFPTAFFGAAFPTALFDATFTTACFGAALGDGAFFGVAFLETALSGVVCRDGTADGTSGSEEASTVIVPGAGATMVSSWESQRTRSIDPTSAVTTPSRSGPLPDERRIR
jgi:hypothetical protein